MTESGNLLVAFGLQALLIATPLAIGLALFIRLTGNLHPRLRYLLACAVFFAVPFGAMVLSGTAVPSEAPSGSSRAVVTTPSSNPGAVQDRGLERAVQPFAILWLAISSALVVREIGGHLLLFARTRRYALCALAVAGETRDVFLADRGVPMTVGLLRPRIILPKRALEELTPAVLESVVRHEESHAVWRDPLVHAVVRITRVLLWPILPIHYMAFVINREAELAADRRACAACDDDSVADYAETLVEAAQWQRTVAANMAPSFTHGSLEQRVRRLFEKPRRSFVRLAAAFVITILAGVVAAGVPVVSPAPAVRDESRPVAAVPDEPTVAGRDVPADVEPTAEPQAVPAPQPGPEARNESAAQPEPPTQPESTIETEPTRQPEPTTKPEAATRSEPTIRSEPSPQPVSIEEPRPDRETEQRTTYRGVPLESQEIDEQIIKREVIEIRDQRIRNVIKIRTP